MSETPELGKSPLIARVDGGKSSQSNLRTGESRHESPALLNLQRVYEQSRRGVLKKDAAKPAEPVPGPPVKGKPRLLLMGQRR